MAHKMKSYYDEKYFDWQKSSGAFRARADLFKFKQFINSTDKVIDFGCGGWIFIGCYRFFRLFWD